MSNTISVRILLLAVAACIALCSSCTTKEEYLAEGILTGWDWRMCPTCGGLMITFSGEARGNKEDKKQEAYNKLFKLIDSCPLFPSVLYAP